MAVGNTQVYLVGTRGLAVVGVGMMGEIYLGRRGAGARRWKRADLTAEKYVAKIPFSEGRERSHRGRTWGGIADGAIEHWGGGTTGEGERIPGSSWGSIQRASEDTRGWREWVREEGEEGEKERRERRSWWRTW